MKSIRYLMPALALALSLAGHAEERGVAAKVNEDTISQAQLQRGVEAVLQQQGLDVAAIRDPGQLKNIRSQVLDQLIAQRLLWQDAQRKKMLAPDSAVEEVIERIRAGLPDEAAFNQRLAEAGLTESEYREDLRQRLSVRMLVRDDITRDIAVSDQEITDFYKSNEQQFRSPEEVQARHILIKLSPDADEAAVSAAQSQIGALLEQARKGEDFAELAKAHSQGPSAPNGGDLGFLRHEQLVKPFADAAFALEPGALSDVVRTQFGLHIIKLEQRRDASLVSQADAAEQIREFLVSQKSRDKIQERVRVLRDAGKVEILGL